MGPGAHQRHMIRKGYARATPASPHRWGHAHPRHPIADDVVWTAAGQSSLAGTFKPARPTCSGSSSQGLGGTRGAAESLAIEIET